MFFKQFSDQYLPNTAKELGSKSDFRDQFPALNGQSYQYLSVSY